jgi:NDP-sugar pyrophosphorylase family protein
MQKELFSLDTYAHKTLFLGCEYPWQALDKIASYLQSYCLGTILGDVHPSAFLVDPETIFIGEGTIVEPGAYIKGPCVIGKGCQIRHTAYIRGDVVIGDRCVIGHATEVKAAVFLDDAHAAHFAYVGDSIIGNKVNLGAGVKCANLRFDGKEVFIRYKGSKIETKRRKLGAIIGDGSQVGCNAVLNPGTILGKETFCLPCSVVGGFHEAKSRV